MGFRKITHMVQLRRTEGKETPGLEQGREKKHWGGGFPRNAKTSISKRREWTMVFFFNLV